MRICCTGMVRDPLRVHLRLCACGFCTYLLEIPLRCVESASLLALDWQHHMRLPIVSSSPSSVPFSVLAVPAPALVPAPASAVPAPVPVPALAPVPALSGPRPHLWLLFPWRLQQWTPPQWAHYWPLLSAAHLLQEQATFVGLWSPLTTCFFFLFLLVETTSQSGWIKKILILFGSKRIVSKY